MLSQQKRHIQQIKRNFDRNIDEYVLYKKVFRSEHKAGDYNWDDIYLNNNDNNSNDYRRFRNWSRV